MQTAINEGNNKLIGSFVQILDIRLSENFMYERFEGAIELIRKLKDFNKYEIKHHDFAHADGALLLYYLVKKPCISDDWFKFFKEVLSEQNSKIDLGVLVCAVHGTALIYARYEGNNNVVELLLEYGAANSYLGSPNAILQSKRNSKQLSYPDKNNPAPRNAGSKGPFRAASALAIAGVALGVAIAVHLEMLAVGIAVGACYLVAAAIIVGL